LIVAPGAILAAAKPCSEAANGDVFLNLCHGESSDGGDMAESDLAVLTI
jgi:hypothetical protein